MIIHNDWGARLAQSREDLSHFPIGTRVRLHFLDYPEGEVIGYKEPWGLLSGKIKCRWDNGDESGWLGTHEVTKLGEH